MASILQILALGAGDSAAPLATPAAPPPIFWRQTLFSIPFQVQRAANPSQEPTQVQLFVSPDRGGRWQNWLQAAPQKGHFLFRAGVDGEYWFDVRTLDRSGQLRPSGPHLAKLVVVVDTVAPKVQLAARAAEGGKVVATFRIEETYPKTDSLVIEYRASPTAPWQAVTVGPTALRSSGAVQTGEVSWYPQNAAGTIEIRLRVSDLAGNMGEGHAQLAVAATTVAGGQTGAVAGAANPFNVGSTKSPSMALPSGGTLDSRAATDASPARTPWPADNAPPATGSNDNRGSASPGGVALRVNQPAREQLISVRDPAASQSPTAPATPTPPFNDFRPAGQASPPNGPAANSSPPLNGFSVGGNGNPNPSRPADVGPPPGEKLRWINSRVFQLTYDTKALGSNGRTPVQLWGTRDGGKTWQSFGTDPLGQSPMLVTVPEEGIYGFQMLLQTGSSAAGRPPLPGERPQTWIGIDLTRPTGRIAQARQGIGRDADKLFLAWEAADNRALADKPISLSYSEQPGGPWTLIASDLPNSGQYTWQLNTHLPQRVYLRLEIRDAAGNSGLFEMSDPIALDLSTPTVPMHELRPLSWIESRSDRQTYLR